MAFHYSLFTIHYSLLEMGLPKKLLDLTILIITLKSESADNTAPNQKIKKRTGGNAQ